MLLQKMMIQITVLRKNQTAAGTEVIPDTALQGRAHFLYISPAILQRMPAEELPPKSHLWG